MDGWKSRKSFVFSRFSSPWLRLLGSIFLSYPHSLELSFLSTSSSIRMLQLLGEEPIYSLYKPPAEPVPSSYEKISLLLNHQLCRSLTLSKEISSAFICWYDGEHKIFNSIVMQNRWERHHLSGPLHLSHLPPPAKTKCPFRTIWGLEGSQGTACLGPSGTAPP